VDGANGGECAGLHQEGGANEGTSSSSRLGLQRRALPTSSSARQCECVTEIYINMVGESPEMVGARRCSVPLSVCRSQPEGPRVGRGQPQATLERRSSGRPPRARATLGLGRPKLAFTRYCFTSRLYCTIIFFANTPFIVQYIVQYYHSLQPPAQV